MLSSPQQSFSPACVELPPLLRLLQKYDFPHKLGVCERLFARSLVRHGVCWVNTAAGLPWKLDLRNSTFRWIAYGKYEGAGFINWASEFLQRDGVVVDSGANVGQMLQYLAQYVPYGRVLAFEPGEHAASWLVECLEANPQLPVEVIRCALGDDEEEAFLEERGAEHFHGGWNIISRSHGRAVGMTTLDRALQQRRIEVVNLWKLDVEGYEIPALRGAIRLLQEKRLRAIRVELAGENGIAIRNFLEGYGYSCFLFNGRDKLVRAEALPLHTNGLFLPR